MLVKKSLKALCQLQNGVTSSLPPFIVDLLKFFRLPKVQLIFSMGILEGVKGRPRERLTMPMG